MLDSDSISALLRKPVGISTGADVTGEPDFVPDESLPARMHAGRINRTVLRAEGLGIVVVEFGTAHGWSVQTSGGKLTVPGITLGVRPYN